MTVISTAIAYKLLVILLTQVIISVEIINPTMVSSHHRMQLTVHPVLIGRKICHCFQREILWRDEALYVSKFAVGAFWAESLSKIHANFLIDVLWPVPKLTMVATQFAETSFVVGTRLLLFRGARL